MNQIANAIARAFVNGPPDAAQLYARASLALGSEANWLRPICAAYAGSFGLFTVRPRERDVRAWLVRQPSFRRSATRRRGHALYWHPIDATMHPAPFATALPIPAIESEAKLADWLQLTPGELEWFADLCGLLAKPGAPQAAQHYVYRLLPKGPSGQVRLIECPKGRLKAIQRQILSEILTPVPPHAAAHGFVRDRNVRSFAAPHTGQLVVLKMDLRDFFPSIPGPQIQAVFRALGYPERVADLLGGLCTNATPSAIWPPGAPRETIDLHRRPHLPQGAPTSPALANICAYRLDCRFSAFAQTCGAVYTRYADDLVFSGNEQFAACVDRFAIHAAVIAAEESFTVNHRKTRIMRRSVRQHIAGVVINENVNLRRGDCDRLKAILTNCIRLGPESQNRDGILHWREHLDGRVAYVHSVNAGRGLKLRELWNQIRWN